MRVVLFASLLPLAFASFLPNGGARAAVASRKTASSLVVALAKPLPEESRSKQILDSAKDEEESRFNEEAAAEAAAARSPEALATLRALGEAAADALRSDSSPAIAKVLETRGKHKVTGKLAKALRKPSGTMALVGEGVAIDAVSLGGYDLNDPEYLSGQFRAGGCVAVSVRVNSPDGIGDDALEKTFSEQSANKGEFPSPIPAIARGPFVDEIQLAAAKAGGAVGVILPLNLNGAEKTAELLASAHDFGIEALVRVSDEAELEAALGMEAKMVVIGDCNLEAATPLMTSLPSGKQGVVGVADFPSFDVRGTWMIRDAGFNACIAGKSMLELCARDRVPPTAVCKAYNSKGSVKYGLGMQKGRLEGAKEDLGTIAM